jgi:RimJ/RimL family protein N-acetyltransferase
MFELGINRIVGLTHPENMASQHVLMKSGLKRHGMGYYYDRDVCYFVAERENFASNPSAE